MSLAPPPPKILEVAGPPPPPQSALDIVYSPPPPESDTPSPPSPPINSTRRAPPSPPSNSTTRVPLTPPTTLGFSPSPPSHSSGLLSTAVFVGIAIGGVTVLVALTLIYLFCKKKRRDHYIPSLGTKDDGTYGVHQQQNVLQPSDHMVTSLSPPKPSTPPPPRLPPVVSSSSISSESTYSDDPGLPPPSGELVLDSYQGTFSYTELERATNGFSEANWLGQGGFGYMRTSSLHYKSMSNGEKNRGPYH